MAAIYAVAPRPLDSVCFPCMCCPRHSHSPHSLQNPQAGPSTSPQSTLKKKASMSFISSTAALAAAKRKRTDTPDETSAESTSTIPPRKPRDGPKKKKANRACYHCQKAHLTCDDCEFPDPFLHSPPYDAFAIFTDTLFDFITSHSSTPLSTVY
jgi:hypothetical protein